MDSNPEIKIEPNSPGVMELLPEKLDDRLRKAYTDSVTKKTMSPLIKEELRCSILSRRHADGQGEIKTEEPKPKRKGVLTEEEKIRKVRRREQNRRAATKCRNKKKAEEERRIDLYQEERTRNIELTVLVEQLRKEKNDLEKTLEEHYKTCVLEHPVYETISPPQSVQPPQSDQNYLSVQQGEFNFSPSLVDNATVLQNNLKMTVTMESQNPLPLPALHQDSERVSTPMIHEPPAQQKSYLSIPPQLPLGFGSQHNMIDPQGLSATSPSLYSGTTAFTYEENVLDKYCIKDSAHACHTVTSADEDLLEENNASVGSSQSWENFSFRDVTELLQSDGTFPILNSEDLNNLV